ncbi:MAG: DUF6232 family protein [Planctomycetota bacterium]
MPSEEALRERTVFQHETIVVTTRRVSVDGREHLTANIELATTQTRPKDVTVGYVTGIVAVLVATGVLAPFSGAVGMVLKLVVSGCLAVVSIAVFRNSKLRYAAILQTKSGEVCIALDTDEQLIANLVVSVNEAIADR